MEAKCSQTKPTVEITLVVGSMNLENAIEYLKGDDKNGKHFK